MWGPKQDMDFWTALAEGEVPAPERRAVKLLRSISDSYRFSLYCYTARFPAMGNITKRTYMVQRCGSVDELHDGCIVASWCIHHERDFYSNTKEPPTDEVIALKNLIEGSEEKLWKIGNRSKVGEGYVGFGPKGNLAFGANPFEAAIGDMTSQDLVELTLDLPVETADWIRRRPDELARALRASADGIRREFRQQ